MQCRAFRFGRLSSSQFQERMEALNEFIRTNKIVHTPQLSASDEEGTIMFVFYEDDKPTQVPIKEKK